MSYAELTEHLHGDADSLATHNTNRCMQWGGPVGRETSLLPWRPTYLRLAILIIFLCIFAAVAAALEVLLYVSVANNGLGITNARQQYLWKYGPTEILTVVAALWGRVEYQSKLAAPWRNKQSVSEAERAYTRQELRTSCHESR